MALVTCPSAFRPRRLAQTVRPDLGPRHLSGKFSHERGCVEILLNSSLTLHDPALQVLNGRSCGYFCEILSNRSLRKEFADAMS